MHSVVRFPSIANKFLFLIMAAVMVILWIEFAPLKVGGKASYVMVNGISMEPKFHGGDLVIVKSASDYRVGDIVTYRDPEMEVYVIHRIIDVEQGRFVIKGDNNAWIDTFHPTKDELVGKLWLHLPKLGQTVLWLRLPINMAFIVGGLGGVLMLGQDQPKNQRGKKKNQQPAGASTGWVELTIYILGFFLLAFLVLTIYSFTQPTMRAADDIEYQHEGVFYYSATSPMGIFDTEVIHSGEPIFTKLTCSIILGFSYNLAGDFQEASGTHQFIAQIIDPQSGWQRTIPLTTETSFNGTSFSSTTPVDLCQFQSLVDTIGEKTGFQPSTTLMITSKMSVSGKSAGQSMYESFDSSLIFQFDKVHFYLIKSGENGPLQSNQSGTIPNPGIQPNTVKILGMDLGVQDLRTIGVGGFGVSLLLSLFLALYVYSLTQRDPEALIRIRYGSLVMDVFERGFENTATVIDVASIEDLAKLAERQNAMILHMTHNQSHCYFIQCEGTTYRYQSRSAPVRQMPQTLRTEIPSTIPAPQVEVPVGLNGNNGNGNGHAPVNFIPKKVVISYDGPLPYNDQEDSN